MIDRAAIDWSSKPASLLPVAAWMCIYIYSRPATTARLSDMEYYRQDQMGFGAILDALTPDNWENAFAATLGPLEGREGRSRNPYNQWRTVLPYLGSLAVWCLSGRQFAPGNAHVEGTDHTRDGENVNYDLVLTNGERESIQNTVRSLFPYPEVQVQGNARYTKYMAIIDRPRAHTYLFILEWNHGDAEDRIAITLRTYNTAPPGHVQDMDGLREQFRRLGFQMQ